MTRKINLLQAHEVRAIRKALLTARWQSYDDLPEWQRPSWYRPGLESMQETPAVPYGCIERDTATGRAICRACGQKIGAGERAITLPWDFAGSGSWTCTQVWLHENCNGGGRENS